MASAIDRLRHEARDLVELVLVPGLAAVLPWRLCFRVFRWLCFHSRFLYRESCERALVQAQARGWVDDPHTWIAKRRLVTLIDHADYFLERTRTDAWMRKHLHVDGAWPAPGRAAVLCTFHWGAGMWALRHAPSVGLHAHMMVAPPRGAHFDGRTVSRLYAVERTASIARALGRPTLDVSASLRPALRALNQHEQVIAVVDVPADQVAVSQPIELLGMTARVPRALFRLAVEQALPVSVFLTGIDLASGERFLRLKDIGVHSDVDTLVREVFLELEKAITDNPQAWHFWSESERFFRT
ncbi:MAG: hypothetical protein QFE16_12480 [Pseudomonadota bacterium]|nr:hypothetical protein [Pseudomonadota bacterium]